MNTSFFDAVPDFSSLVELARWRAAQQPERRGYTFLIDGEVEGDHLTFTDLDRKARAVAALLQSYVEKGERALLIYPSGLEFITAFFGCLYAGVVAVPTYPPQTRTKRNLSQLQSIANDVEPSLLLTTSSLIHPVKELFAQAPELQSVPLISTDTLSDNLAEQWQEPLVDRNTLAFFQYTSGSTGMPKGAMLTHGNLMHNLALIARSFELTRDSHGIIWLPLFHDMGLIGGILQVPYCGGQSTIMSPAAFLQRPVRWLQAISSRRASVSGGPNFAYDFCARKITAEQRATLDLSSWEVAFTGAETIRQESLEIFDAAFSPYGFRRESFFPCYGLAEATLMVTGGLKGAQPVMRTFQKTALEHNRVVEAPVENGDRRTLVGCGQVLPGSKVVIVDPQSLTPCPPGAIGEIWVASPGVVQGYWQQPEETERTFHAFLARTGEGPFLRTGDLGFLQDGELFLTGRLKDLIIIRGRNHYPDDIELAVEKSHPALKPNSGIAFSVDVAGEERLVVVQEVERQYRNVDVAEVAGDILQAVAEQHEVQVYAVVLVKTGSIPKTSSGKPQRRLCREKFLNNNLDVVGKWMQNLEESGPQMAVSTSSTDEDNVQRPSVVTAPETAEAIQVWLVSQIAERLKVHPSRIDVREPLAHYGMDSVQAVSIAGDLEAWLGRRLPPTLAYDYPTIHALAQYLADAPTNATEPGGDKHGSYGAVGADSLGNYQVLTASQPVRKDTEREDQTGLIAITGIGCRFPGAKNPEAFWQLLRDGVDAITEVPADRWDLHTYYNANQAVPGKMNTRWGGFLEQVDQFDPSFFKISPREAAQMDPQQRLLLEVAWEALEHAGQAPDKLAGSQTGVFIGISSSDYAQLRADDVNALTLLDAYTGTGNAHSIAANRISYLLDLRGPSLVVDTACSSSLISVHLACQSLRNGECKLALAGGVNIILTPDLTITFSQARMMASNGRCKTFDADAEGYVRAEGCGLVVLKPLVDALRDGDNILALLRGSAVNQDGRSNGLTAPNSLAQQAVIRQALKNANVEPEEISYIECHGSSTPLGDPIEFEALKAVLMPGRSNGQACVLSSVKTNIGHLEAAAGIAGLIKTVLCLQKGEIPPHLHLKKLNPNISLTHTTFSIPTERQPWPEGMRRLAGVSSFGFGGTNAHVILEAAPARSHKTNDVERPLHLFTLSAQTETALQTLAGRYEEFLTANADTSIADICFSANTGHSHFDHRLAFPVNSSTQLRKHLADVAAGRKNQNVHSGQVTAGRGYRDVGTAVDSPDKAPSLTLKPVFLFTGQGSQYPEMGRQLYETQPTFRNALDRCNEILLSYLEQPLLSVLYPENAEVRLHTTPLPPTKARSQPLLQETIYTQPALFALEYALAELWRSWGVEPAVVMGHSLGEYVAACVAGVFSLEDGLKLVAERARLMQALTRRGAMAVVFADHDQVASRLFPFQDQIAVAAINGPRNTVLSGERDALHPVLQRLEAEGVMSHPLAVSHAFHSPLMDPMLPEFEQVAFQVHFEAPRIPLIANLTGKKMQPGEIPDADFWLRQTRETVQFAAGMHSLVGESYDVFVEIGPTNTLLSMGKHCFPAGTGTWLPSLVKGQEDWQVLLNTLASLYGKGMSLDWVGFDRNYARRRISLPTYPFERERYWLPTSQAERSPNGKPAQQTSVSVQQHPLLHSHLQLAHPPGQYVWNSELDRRNLPYLNDHRIQETVVVPVSVYLEMAEAATVETFGSRPFVLKEVEFKKALFLPEKRPQMVQVILSSYRDEETSFSIYSCPEEVEQSQKSWVLHVTGKIRHT